MKAVINVIYFLSVLSLLYGGFTYFSNMPQKFDTRGNIFSGLNTYAENQSRAAKQEDSTVFIIVGGVGIAVGFIIQMSNKKGE